MWHRWRAGRGIMMAVAMVMVGCRDPKPPTPPETNLCKYLRTQGVLGVANSGKGDDYMCQNLPGSLLVGDFGPASSPDANSVMVCGANTSRAEAVAAWKQRGMMKETDTSLPEFSRRVIFTGSGKVQADTKALAARTGLATISSLQQIAGWLPTLDLKSDAALDLTVSVRFHEGAKIEKLQSVFQLVERASPSCRAQLCREGTRFTYKRLVARPLIEITTARAGGFDANMLDIQKLGMGGRFEAKLKDRRTIRLMARQPLTIASRAYPLRETFGDACAAPIKAPVQAWYPDRDGDGFGDASAPAVRAATQPERHVLDRSDCDDADPAVRQWSWYRRTPGHACACDTSTPAPTLACEAPSPQHTRARCDGEAGVVTVHGHRHVKATVREQRQASITTRDAHCSKHCKKWRGYHNRITLAIPAGERADMSSCRLTQTSGPRGWNEVVRPPTLRPGGRAVDAEVRVWTRSQRWVLRCATTRDTIRAEAFTQPHPITYRAPLVLRQASKTLPGMTLHYKTPTGATQRVSVGAAAPKVGLRLADAKLRTWTYRVCAP